jgi:hypothetical protein
MISSVIIKLDPAGSDPASIIETVSSQPEFETGELVGSHSLPITIETETGDEMESKTRWLGQLPGVMFVDVVYVHLGTP